MTISRHPHLSGAPRAKGRTHLSRCSFHAPSHSSIFTVVQPLSIQSLEKRSCRNSFVSKTIRFDCEAAPRRRSDAPAFRRVFEPIPSLFMFLRTLLHIRKVQVFSFQSLPHSLRKTTRGGGGWPSFLDFSGDSSCNTVYRTRTTDHDSPTQEAHPAGCNLQERVLTCRTL